MKKYIVFILCLCMLMSLSSCAFLPLLKKSPSSDISSLAPESDPSSVEVPQDSVTPFDQLTYAELQSLTEEYSRAWFNYNNFSVCCNFGDSRSDLSQYIGSDMLTYYNGSVTQISCCNTISEAKDHYKRMFSEHLYLYSKSGISSQLLEHDGHLYYVGDTNISVSMDLTSINIKDIQSDHLTFTVNWVNNSDGKAFAAEELFMVIEDGEYIVSAVTDVTKDYLPQSSQPESSSKPESSKPSSSKKLVKPDEFFDPGYHCHVKVRSGGLNLRYGPGEKYGRIALIPNGTSLVEQGYKDGWIYVKYKDQYGWVSMEFIEYDEMGMAKPVIYLYPEKKTDVKVSLDIKNGHLTCTYPQYNNGWNVTAYPDGHIVNKADGLEYSYLYWEADSNTKFDLSEGFVVAGKDTAKFLQTTLSKMGLTPKEYNEFIVYWLPLMQNNKYNLITFQQEEYTDAAKLSISPKPDSMLRVFMAFKPLDKPVSVKTPVINKFERKGFTVVEWGGSEIK